MKTIKYLALTLVALLGMTSCSKDGNHQTIDDTYVSYVYASFAYASNFYSGDGTVNVKMKDGSYTITAKNAEWGEAVFENVKMGEQWEGAGTITVPARREIDEPTTYEAQISGTLEDIVITAPTLMNGGTVLHFYIGRIPGEKAAGTFSGTNSVNVGDQWTYTADINYEITANEDGSINLILPEYTLTGTEIGDLTLGGYTITGITFDVSRGAFYSDYGTQELTMHFKAVNGGRTTMDNDYIISPTSHISIEPINKNGRQGVKVVNSFGLGRIVNGQFTTTMPFDLTATFEGAIQRAQ